MGGRAERGGIVTTWLLQIVVVLALVAIVMNDLIAIAVARVDASEDAQAIAEAAATSMSLQRLPADRALAVARIQARGRGVALGPQDLTITRTGTVRVRVTRPAATLVVQHIGPLAQWAQVDDVVTIAAEPR